LICYVWLSAIIDKQEFVLAFHSYGGGISRIYWKLEEMGKMGPIGEMGEMGEIGKMITIGRMGEMGKILARRPYRRLICAALGRSVQATFTQLRR
jgi:hypothetical protein